MQAKYAYILEKGELFLAQGQKIKIIEKRHDLAHLHINMNSYRILTISDISGT